MGVVISTLFGPAQVLSRLINMMFGAELPPQNARRQCSAVGDRDPAAERAIGDWRDSVLDYLRAWIRLGSIIQGTLPLRLFGRAGYGELVGRVAAVRLIVSAVAPFVFASLMQNLNTRWALTLTAVLGAGEIVSFL